MGKFFRTIILWALLALMGFLAGDRYGAPTLLSSLSTPLFEAIETRLGVSESVGATEGDSQSASAGERAVPSPAPAQTPSTATPSASTAADGNGIPANANLRMNAAGIQIIKESEGLKLEAYTAGGRRYIGYGRQISAGDPQRITEAQAEEYLREDLRSFEDGVRRVLTRPANENQFSAMVSLAYNLGVGRFRSASPVLKEFNAGNISAAADAFRTHNRGGGVVLQNLVERREKERALFLTPA
ncbi:MAG: lysozyme [Pseudomonadota bacterium]